jgi:Uma2 family endonuclease
MSSTSHATTLEELEGTWELVGGSLREKPSMSFGHNRAARKLLIQLLRQLDDREYMVLPNAGHLSLPGGDSYIPDLAIVPVGLASQFRDNWRQFETYAEPVLLVVEIWSPSTGAYDIDAKIPGYQQRGDAEIWRIHPFDGSVRIWTRGDDGRYADRIETTGTVTLHALPAVRIDLDALFWRGEQ